MTLNGPHPSATAPPARDEGPLSEDERILHVLSRLTPGATAGLIAEVRASGLGPWLERQLLGEPRDAARGAPYRPLVEPQALTSRLAEFELLEMNNLELSRATSEAISIRAPQFAARELRHWVLLRAVYGANHVREAACDFFRNHFAVSIDKEQLRFLGLGWERDVIQGHALGRFHDLLDATARHPAMLLYLDNHLSRRPLTNSELRKLERAARRESDAPQRARAALDIARQRGLNENYARELLELHTLGVDRHYTQQDVVTVAKAFTGWTIDRARWEFFFNPDMHQRERKQLFGLTLQGRGGNEGEAVLDILKRHPGTSQFLAAKLCLWFVHDEPDEKLVKRVADVFHRTGGDMPRVLRAIVEDRSFFARENFRTKFKRPWEFVVSALRATGAELSDCAGTLGAIDAMSEALYRCPDPTGYYDQAEAWRDPGAIAVRWTFAVDLLAGRVRGVRVPPTLFEGLAPDRPDEWKDLLVRRILPVAGVGGATDAALDRLVRSEARRGLSSVGPRIVSVLLGSPEFQRQ
jgi:uncharacterized protein (DUF1800 family)